MDESLWPAAWEDFRVSGVEGETVQEREKKHAAKQFIPKIIFFIIYLVFSFLKNIATFIYIVLYTTEIDKSASQ